MRCRWRIARAGWRGITLPIRACPLPSLLVIIFCSEKNKFEQFQTNKSRGGKQNRHTMSFTLNTSLMASNYAGNTKKATANGVIFAGWAAGLVAGPR